MLAVVKARVALAQSKKCDAVEPDDARSNNPGLPITAAQQQAFVEAIAAEAHAKNMSVALKTDLDEISQRPCRSGFSTLINPC